ncbi:uncharacterized protein FOMMEDRAFT_144379 [Fomitiporia mediterranea MF3/22]|uniref:uncharacterized protein n=1 Tax=Fomitiporia mediterranea (strain MF3/22) TaxID=694068 RepID=UPI000440892B|nr:uncharacterized protein FOMMEDRAFT_144379 [Fomitiporia mediterranea MF3/22]EJD08543.1 hypothetical protein FOMMEDRAFT_144379 [Fomitiporia mediterranea MF3/22]
MAQALYTQHPLDEYLKESGDRRERLPGAFLDASDEEPEASLTADECAELTLPVSSLTDLLEVIQQWATVFRHIFLSTSDDFAERFKYDLISSNLLSSSVSPSPVSTHSQPAFPARDQRLPGDLKTPQQDTVEKTDQDLKPLSSAFVLLGLVALLKHHRLTAFLALLTSVSFAKAPGIGSSKSSYIPQMFEALDSLKTAGAAWDLAVNDAITMVEAEERSTYYSPSPSASPPASSALRVALHSTLLTTQQQCDNVRPLLAALASPMELSQLSEMYGPPDPSKPSYTLQARNSPPRHKHSSLSENNISRLSPRSPSASEEKRQTWNGSNITILGRNAATTSTIRRKDRRSSDLSTFSALQDSPFPSPLTPPRSPSLAQVLEDDEEENQGKDNSRLGGLSREDSLPQDHFGTAALYLRRRRRASGAEVLGLPSARSVPSLRDSVHRSSPSVSSQRFTSLSSVRHPFSLSALHHVLQGALASRRYSCAHLLALRFTEDSEDESYWENVRSVTALLISTLEDATARLNVALAEADNLKRQEAQPTPESSPDSSPATAPNEELHASRPPSIHATGPLTSPSHHSKPSALLNLPNSSTNDIDCFAPVPSAVARFASHVDALSSSLGDARGHLIESVEELRDVQNVGLPQSSERTTHKASEESVMQSYERLRRELGFALRECERGRAALLDIFESPRLRSLTLGEEDETDVVAGESPFSRSRLHPLSSSSKDSNDKTDTDILTPDEGSPVIPILSSLDDASNERDVDDASQHLLLSTSTTHLPPPGLEQIFESESTPFTSFNRERSKMSREERIRLMKAKRESMNGRGLAAQLDDEDDIGKPARRGSWGPGTEVVEELKDVIWKVGERRRKMAEESRAPSATIGPTSTTTIPSAPELHNNNISPDGSNDYDTSLCTS